jgi:hypothetical protein
VDDPGKNAHKDKVIAKREGTGDGFKGEFIRNRYDDEDGHVPGELEKIVVDKRRGDETPQLAVFDDKARRKGEEMGAGWAQEGHLADADDNQ